MGKGSSGKARRGGAGIPSTPGISENERAAAGMERIKQERYDQVKKMFEDELGFKNAANLAYAVKNGEVNMALIGAQARKLKQLERVYGAIGQSIEGGWGDMKQMAANASGNTVARVLHMRHDPSVQSLEINKKYYLSLSRSTVPRRVILCQNTVHPVRRSSSLKHSQALTAEAPTHSARQCRIG